MTPPDANFRSYADETDLVLEWLSIAPQMEGKDAADFDDLLKFSRVQRARVSRCLIRGNGRQRENAIDLNRGCEDIVIEDCRIEAGRQNAITIKGGCQRVSLRRLAIERAGGHCDIELGNWSDQSPARTIGVTLEDVRRADGKPVRVRVGNADWPMIRGGNVRIQYFQSYVLKAYLWAKRASRTWFAGRLTFLMP